MTQRLLHQGKIDVTGHQVGAERVLQAMWVALVRRQSSRFGN